MILRRLGRFLISNRDWVSASQGTQGQKLRGGGYGGKGQSEN
jgi:hypothetical protein